MGHFRPLIGNGNGTGFWLERHELGREKEESGTDDSGSKTRKGRYDWGVQDPQWTHNNWSKKVLGGKGSEEQGAVSEKLCRKWEVQKWNLLPAKLKMAPSLDCFKSRLDAMITDRGRRLATWSTFACGLIVWNHLNKMLSCLLFEVRKKWTTIFCPKD